MFKVMCKFVFLSVAVSTFLLPVISLGAEDLESYPTAALTPYAWLENAQMFGVGKRIYVYRVPTRDTAGKVQYYNLTIDLTVLNDGKIATTAPVVSSVSPDFNTNKFIAGTYTTGNSCATNLKPTCTVGTSVAAGGRMMGSVLCIDAYGNSLSASWATGPIAGHPFEMDLKAAGIDKIPGAANYAWGKVGSVSHCYGSDWWGCFSDGYIVSAQQTGNVLTLNCYENGNIQKCGNSLTKK